MVKKNYFHKTYNKESNKTVETGMSSVIRTKTIVFFFIVKKIIVLEKHPESADLGQAGNFPPYCGLHR